MIWLYDDAICNDLKKSFNPDSLDNPVVKVVDTEAVVGLAAQIHEDQIRFPIVAVTRNPDVGIDDSRITFTALHKGVEAVLEEDTNNIFYEKSIPIDLRYSLTVLTTNTYDMDEIVKELMFKYLNMYFLTIDLPYEAKRKIRFGIRIDRGGEIQRESGSYEYIQGGKLYQTILPLVCEGAVMVSYTPAHLRREAHETVAVTRDQAEKLNLI